MFCQIRAPDACGGREAAGAELRARRKDVPGPPASVWFEQDARFPKTGRTPMIHSTTPPVQPPLRTLRLARRTCVSPARALRLARRMYLRPLRELRGRASQRCSVVPPLGGSGSGCEVCGPCDPEPPKGGTTIHAHGTAARWSFAMPDAPHSSFQTQRSHWIEDE
jgi:hypothetical protein